MQKMIYPAFFLLLITACSSSESRVTEEEIKTQNKIDAIVASALFDRELDDHASYNIRKDGMIVIKFDDTVAEAAYTEVVNALRTNTHITMLRAEQSGVEVCGLR